MSAAPKLHEISVEDYLASEADSLVKREYVGGYVYAMAGGSNSHNLIASNMLVAAGSRLRGTGCRAYNSDAKIRIRLSNQTRFYYPDLSIICRPNAPGESFQDDPAVIVEVLSRKTRRIDEGEKREAYLTIPSLSFYLRVEQDRPLIVADQRSDHGFVRETYTGLDTSLPLSELNIELPLAEVYDGVEFAPEVDPE